MKSHNIIKGDIGIPAAEDGDIDSCPLWTTVSHQAYPHLPSIPFGSWSQASFSLPDNMDSLYLVAHGPLASGDLYVSESPKVKDVSVKVYVHHRGWKALSRAAACQLNRGDGQAGVGIFVCRHLSGRQIFDYSLSRLPVDGLLTGPSLQGMPYTLWSKWSSPRALAQFVIYHHLKQISPGSLWTWTIYPPFASVTSV